MKKLAVALAAVTVACIVSGCVTYVTTKNEPRQSARFTSPAAAETFYDAYLASEHRSSYYRTNAVSHTVTISIYLPYLHYKTSTENVRFNHALELADANHDGVISDAEAREYAAKVRRLTFAGKD